MISAGILGASGYSGNELANILSAHPKVELKFAQSKSNKGKLIREFYPDSSAEMVYSDPSLSEINKADVVFLSLPKEEAAAIAPKIKGVVIDLSPAHRFSDGYIYGLPEMNAVQIREADRIANPGCYATACLLAALPLLGFKPASLAFDCKSGYSGGGKSKKYEFEENLIPYSLDAHYQKPEIGKFVSVPFTFAPHVVNAFRGLIATVHAFGLPAELKDSDDLAKHYLQFYKGKPFVKLVNGIPTFNSVKKTPYCEIGGITASGGNAIIVSAIDNLLKGASSQAVQNMNLRFSLKETDGLIK